MLVLPITQDVYQAILADGMREVCFKHIPYWDSRLSQYAGAPVWLALRSGYGPGRPTLYAHCVPVLTSMYWVIRIVEIVRDPVLTVR